jgi:hypothetical protein
LEHDLTLSKKSHKTTLFHTIAHFRGCSQGGQAIFPSENSDLSNEIKDLAAFLEKWPKQKPLRN